MEAISQDDTAKAAKALKDGAKINMETMDDYGDYGDRNTPLCLAAERGELDFVKFLVARGASVVAGTSSWTNPVEIAIGKGYTDVVKYLHDQGTACDPLLFAAGTGDVDQVTKLAAAAEPKKLTDAAKTAAGCGEIGTLKVLLGRGADAAAAFKRAASTGALGAMSYLLDHGVDIKKAGYDALCNAAQHNQTDVVAFLLKQKVNPNRQKQPGDTRLTDITPPLNQAASAGAVASVKLLLEAGADPNSAIVGDPHMGGTGDRPLNAACETDNPEIVRLLLDHGANLELANSQGFTPLLYAALSHAAKCVALLIERGGDMKAWNPSWKADIVAAAAIFNGEDADRPDMPTTTHIINRCEATMQVLLDHGMDINSTSRNGSSLLSIALVNGQTAMIKMLLERGAKVNTVDSGGGTPLIRLITSLVRQKRYFETLNELLEKGADPNLGNGNPIGTGNEAAPSALKGAIASSAYSKEDRIQTISILLAHGARFSVPKDSDADKMLLAATAGNADAVKKMLAKGVSPNVADSKGWTPLLSAAALGYDDILKALIDAGADVNAHDSMGLTALPLVMQKYPDLTDFHLLMAKGADINATSQSIFSAPAIDTAIGHDDPGLLREMIKEGANPNNPPTTPESQFTPLEQTVDSLNRNPADQKYREIFTILMAAGANPYPKREGYWGWLLYFPVMNNDTDLVKFLLKAGIDPKKDYNGGKEVSDAAARYGNAEMKSIIAVAMAQSGTPAK